MAYNGGDSAAKRREEAYLELLAICAEQNVVIPDSVKKAIESDVDNDMVMDLPKIRKPANRSRARGTAGMSILESAILENKEQVEAAAEEDENFALIRKMWAGVKASPPHYDCRVRDGSYTAIIPVEEDDGTGKDEEMAGGRRVMQKIMTVKTENVVYKFFSTIAKIIRTGRCQVRPNLTEKVIMDGVDLTFDSGKIYLVLGAPGSGKSTLLKMIADSLRRDDKHIKGGKVSINGINACDKDVVWSNLTAYIDQIDRLHKYLTVLETCTFAFQCRYGGTHDQSYIDTEDPEVRALIEKMDEELFLVNTVLKGMGLARVNDTYVGDNESVRGVSGGEKKRVTVSEMWCVGVPVMCCDEISTGLDAATTYDIVKLMGSTSRLSNAIRIISLLQPPPETVALFDELILLDEGRVIYSGPVDEVVPYFESLGYKLPDRMDTADWLQVLPSRDGAQFLADDGMERRQHLSNEEFVQKFKESKHGQRIVAKLDEPMEMDPRVQTVAEEKFRNTWQRSLKLLVARELLLWWRDKFAIRSRIIQDLLMGIVAGTLFWQQNDNPQSVIGILFQSMFFISLGSMQRVPEQFDLRGILYKHQDANFFPTWTFVVGRSLASVPTAMIDSIVYGTIIYWFVGLAYNEGASIAAFFIFLLIVFIASLSTGLFFSVFSATVSDKPRGQAGMAMATVLFVLFSGFAVQPDIIPDYWIWAYWINVFAWILRSLVVNEYESGKYEGDMTLKPGVTEGEAILIQFGFTDGGGDPFGFVWVWYGVAYAFGFSLVCACVSCYALRAIRFETGQALATTGGDGDFVDEGEKGPREEVALQFQPVNLTFKDIRYTVTASTSNEKLELLKGIDGYLEAGKMTALMGSSGAGKTTLMDVLSLRKSSGEIGGEVRLNGHLQEPLSFRRCTGYVEQFDVQSPQLTIRETVAFSAALRLEETDPEVTPEAVDKFVDQTLDILELTEIQDLQVGSDLTGGLSFEQNKRLSIAVELVANPSILFLDEPTSGLDARAASIVMRGLRRITDGGRAVCATIHQPSITIFSGFDALLLLKRGGETVFFGELGENSEHLIDYLESYPATPGIRPGENPATWMLTTIGAGSSSTGAQPFDYAGSFAGSKLREKALLDIEEFDKDASEDTMVWFPEPYATDGITQAKCVLQRTLKIYWRSPSYNLVRMLVSIFVAVLFGSIYVQQRTPENESDMNSRVTSIYITSLFLGVNALNTVLPVYEIERNMFYRHKAALMYNQRATLLAFTLAEIPFLVAATFLFVIPFYFMSGLAYEADKFFLFWLFYFLNTGLFTFVGQLCVALSKDGQAAQGLGSLFIGLTSLFAGLLIRPQDINTFWLFAYWALPGHYTLEGLVTSQFRDDDTEILPSLGTPFQTFVIQTPECQEFIAMGEDPNLCTGTAEQWVAVSFGGEFSPDNIKWDVVYLVLAMFLVKAATALALNKLNFLAK